MLMVLLACAQPTLDDSSVEDDTQLPADDSDPPKDDKDGRVYAGPIEIAGPQAEEDAPFCSGEVEITIKGGEYTGTGGCTATPPEGASFELPVELQGTVDEDDACTGVITMTMSHPEGELELSGDLSGGIARGTMSLDFVVELPPPPESEDGPAEAAGRIEAHVQDPPD